MLQTFDKCETDFVGSINPPTIRSGAKYIIIVIDYLTKWEESTSVIDYTTNTAKRFLFNNVVT
jgi:hypothetical protein